MDEVRIAPARVTLAPATLFDAACVALESDEFVQVRAAMRDANNGRCAWGVVRTVMGRAGLNSWSDVHPRMVDIERRAGQLLGYDGIESANDAGEPFGIIAAALRRARIEVEQG